MTTLNSNTTTMTSRKRPSSTGKLIESNIPTSNSFDGFAGFDDETLDDVDTNIAACSSQTAQKKDKIPPIVVGTIYVDKIKKICHELKITDFQLKFMSIVVSISLTTMDIVINLLLMLLIKHQI